MNHSDPSSLERENARLRRQVAELRAQLERQPASAATAPPPPLVHWEDLLAQVPSFVILTDLAGQIEYINRSDDDLRPADLIGASIFSYLSDAHHDEAWEAVRRVIATAQPQHYEVQYMQSGVWYTNAVAPLVIEGQVRKLVFASQVSTQRRHGERLERELRESEERFRAIATSIPVPITITALTDGKVLYVNQRLADTMRTTPEELLGQSVLQFYIDPDDRQPLLETLLREGSVSDYEVRLRQRDGESLWALMSMRRLIYQGQDAVVASLLDITERHAAEEHLRHERRLLQRLLELQERDRQLIAYEIHDGFVQDVVGGKMMIEAIIARLESPPDPRLRELRQAENLLSRAIDEGRRMIGELRPLIIDEEGIVAAILYLANSEQQRGGPEVTLADNIQFDRLDPMLEGTVFRIVQEGLSNAIRHGGAERIEVRLTQVDEELHIEIEDAGVGFDPRLVPDDRFGLRSIQERARLFGGRATIHSRPGQGTRVHAVVPISLDHSGGERESD